MTELKSCPFCQCDMVYGHKNDEGFKLRCPACGAEIRRETKEEAFKAWNTRQEPTCNMTFNAVSGMVECSRCHEMFVAGSYYIDEGIWKHCPNCGAKVVDE